MRSSANSPASRRRIRSPILDGAVIGAIFLSAGCSSMPRASDDVVLENSARTITFEEWLMFSNKMLTSLNESGVLARYRAEATGPVPIMIGDFRNDTDRAEFTNTKDVMLDAVRKQLVNTGQAGITSDVGGTGTQIDRSIGDAMSLWESAAYDKTKLVAQGKFVGPMVILGGGFVSVDGIREGLTDQYEYACSLRLIDVRTSQVVWSEQVVFPKQFQRAFIGK